MNNFLTTIIGATAIAIVQPQIILAQTETPFDLQAIQEIARKVTVKVNPYGNWGSGAIVGQNGNVYYVLTATHVVDKLVEGDELLVVTYDDEYHAANIDNIQRLPDNLDLTLIQFTNNKPEQQYESVVISAYNYPLYESRDYENSASGDANQKQYAFVSGWPLGRDSWDICQGEQPPASCQQPVFNPGFLFDNSATAISQPSVANPNDNFRGYDLIYTNLTHPGVSGGPVLDTKGRLIGIHGRADGRNVTENGEVLDEYLDEQELQQLAESDVDIFRVKVGMSLGIPSKTFLVWAATDPVNSFLAIEDSAPPTIESTNLESTLPPLVLDETNPYHWIEKGNQLWRIDRPVLALDSFDRAIELQEDLYLAWFAKGFALGFDRQFELALAACDRAIELNVSPNKIKYESHRCRAGALQQLNRPEESLAALNEAIDIDPSNPADLMLQGELHFAVGEYDTALQSLDTAVKMRIEQKLAPSALLYNNKALVELSLEQYEPALSDVEQAISIDSNFAPAYRNKGLILETIDRNEESLAAYDRALELAPEDYNTWTNKGFALYKLQRIDEAKQAFQRALEINPDYQPAINNLEAIGSDL